MGADALIEQFVAERERNDALEFHLNPLALSD